MSERENILLTSLGLESLEEPGEAETAPVPKVNTEGTDDAQQTWRTEAAKAHDLPPGLADRLRGDSEAAVFSDAERLAAAVRPAPAPMLSEATLLARAALANAERVRRMLPPDVTTGDEQ